MSRGVAPLGTIDVAGSVVHLKLDDSGHRLISTVRYPEGGRRRDELHLHELPRSGLRSAPEGPGPPVHRLTSEIDDAEAVALSSDGERLAVGCGAGVCIQGWGTGAVEKRLVASGRPREIGALAFRPDVGLAAANAPGSCSRASRTA